MSHEQIEDSYIDPMTGFVTVKVNKEEYERLKSATPCTYPDCVSASSVRVAGDSYPRGYAEGLREAAEIVEGECQRVLAVQTGALDSFSRSVDSQVRMTAVLLPDLAGAIRATAPVAEVCEWTPREAGEPFYRVSCSDRYLGWIICEVHQKFCLYCGRPMEVKGCP